MICVFVSVCSFNIQTAGTSNKLSPDEDPLLSFLTPFTVPFLS